MRTSFRRQVRALAVILVSIVSRAPRPAAGSTQISPQSPEFQVNSYTSFAQDRPMIAADAAGDFVVVWQQRDAGAIVTEAMGRRFSSAGAPLGVEFQVNSFSTGIQARPMVGRSGAGSFVVVWDSDGQDGNSYGVFGRRYDAAGHPLAAEFQINTYTPGSQIRPAIAMRSGGDFVVAWGSAEQDGSGVGIFGRRFDASGTALAVEFQINEYTTSDQAAASLAQKADGSFVVSWTSNGQDGDGFGAFARVFDSSGSALGGDFQLNLYTVGAQSFANVAYDPDGLAFGVTWQSMDQDGSGLGVYARGFDSDGSNGDDGEFQINSFTSGDQGFAVPAVLADGTFVIVWQSEQDGSSYGVFARAIDDDVGAGVSDEILLNTYVISAQVAPRVVATGQRFTVVWQSGGQDGNGFGIFGRRFVNPSTLDVDGSGDIQPLTDGLLVLRYEFGFRGATLVTGAVGPNCTRCTAPAIEAYLASV
jgi:hypothetical protein